MPQRGGSFDARPALIASTEPLQQENSEDELAALLEIELSGADGPSERLEGRKRRRTASGGETLVEEEAGQQSKRRLKGDKTGSAEVCPPHPGTIHGICIRCGAAFSDGEGSDVALRYIHRRLQISQAEAARVRERGLQKVLASQKFLLVLDLDHTLLCSTRFNEIPEALEGRLRKLLDQQGDSPGKTLFRLEHMAMWTKLRPAVREFLAAANELAEVHIYTHGDREYAAAMASILDPGRAFFGGRIISQSDSTQRGVKHLDVVLGAEAAAVILDDTEGVWPQHRDNLVQVERYIFFPADAARFWSGPSLLERGEDESASEGQLSTALRVLRTLHSKSFEGGSSGSVPFDVRPHLRRLRAEILDGVHICFTKLIPLGTARPEQQPLWRLATRLGASCSLQMHDGVTHVVAGDPKTEKAALAELRGLPVVSPEWLHACSFLWRRMGEELYPLVRGQAAVAQRSEKSDVEAAMSAAGGGRASSEGLGA